ncbi:hypothetical protein Tco_0231318 [Tanacetum coccineum]
MDDVVFLIHQTNRHHQQRSIVASSNEDNNIVVLVTDTADTSQLQSIVCSSGLSNHSKIAFVESSDYKAKEGACTLSRRMNLRKGLEIGCTTLLDKANGDDTRFHFMTTEMMLKQICMQPKLDDYRVSERIIEFFDDPHIFRTTRVGLTEVNIVYAHSAVPDMVQAAILATMKIHLSQPVDGDILIFLASDEDISTAKRLLKTSSVGFERNLYVFAYEEFTSGTGSVVSTGS